MIITVLVCSNGWQAIYGPDGKRLGEYPPGMVEGTWKLRKDRVAFAKELPGITFVERQVPVDPAYKDFPEQIVVQP